LGSSSPTVRDMYRKVFRRPGGRVASGGILRALLALLVAAAGLVGVNAGPASSQADGVNASITLDGETYDGKSVVEAGQTLNLKVQYNSNVEPGSTVTFDFSDNVSVTDVPEGNKAIEELTQNG